MFSLLKKRTLISIVVTSYNREQYIKECIDSILSQDIDKEIICIDDCSTDKTCDILQDYENKYEELSVYQNEKNSGIVFTRYQGLIRCKGEYMLFVDSDDYLLPNSLNKLYWEAKNNNADILEFSSQTDGSDEFKKALKRPNYIIDITPLEAYSNKQLKNQLWNKLISRKVYKKAIKNMNMEIKHEDFSDVVYFLYHFLINSDRVITTETEGYFYYDKRGMTAHIDTLGRLKQYCGFGITKNELENVYGKIPELTNTWNYVCNQAVCTLLELSEEEQKEHMHQLYRLMSENAAKKLIEGHKQLMKQKDK